jgi:hypothetical protein
LSLLAISPRWNSIFGVYFAFGNNRPRAHLSLADSSTGPACRVASPTLPPHVVVSISVREIKPLSYHRPPVVAPPQPKPPHPLSPVGKHAMPSSPPLSFTGHRHRRSHPHPPLFSPVSAAPTLLYFPPLTATTRPDAFPPP